MLPRYGRRSAHRPVKGTVKILLNGRRAAPPPTPPPITRSGRALTPIAPAEGAPPAGVLDADASGDDAVPHRSATGERWIGRRRSEQHTSELQSQSNLVC